MSKVSLKLDKSEAEWLLATVKGHPRLMTDQEHKYTGELVGLLTTFIASSGIDHQDMVRQLAKPGDAIVAQMDGAKMHLLHMAVGVSGEAGELLDAVKKHAVYNKPIDRTNVIEELGDLEFYMEGLRQGLDITRAETLEANIAKLGARYKGHNYSDAAAQARVDKEGEKK